MAETLSEVLNERITKEVRDVLDSAWDARKVHIEILAEVGEVPILRYEIEKQVIERR